MTLDIIQARTQAGSPTRANEDACGYTGKTAWVIDGASGLGNQRYVANDNSRETDAAWLAQRLNDFFREKAPVYGGDLVGLLRTARANLSNQFNTAARIVPMAGYELPVAAVTLLYADAKNGVKIARLGDAVAMLRGCDYRIDGLFDNPALQGAEARTKAAMRAGEDVMAVQRANRANANARDGFGVFALRDDFTQLITQYHRPGPESGEAVLMSDGFYRLVDVFGTHDKGDLFQDIQHRGLGPLFDRLRRQELQTRNSEIKRHDDATAVHLRIG